VDNIIIEAAISTNRRITIIIIDEVINRVKVIEYILGPTCGHLKQQRKVNHHRQGLLEILFGAQRVAI
jgi:hypothetical protein